MADLDPKTRPVSHRSKPVIKVRRKNISSIDLSEDRDQNECGKYGPRESEQLHQLHNSVTMGLSVPKLTAETTNFSFATTSQPQKSFLDSYVHFGISNQSGKLSSNDSDDWTDSFPSPSLLLSQTTSDKRLPLKVNNSHAVDKTTLDSILASSNINYEDDHGSIKTSNNRKRQTNDLAARDFTRIQWDTSSPPLPTLSMITSETIDDFRCVGSDARLFFSADSPEKTTIPEKRTLGASLETPQPKEEQISKRRPETGTSRLYRCLSDQDSHTTKKRRVSRATNA